jgi:hypothetical protein
MNDLDRYLDDFGRTLRAAEAEARAKRPRRRLAWTVGAASAAAIAITIVLLALPSGGTTRLDVLAEARAALAPVDGAITHLVYVSRPERGTAIPAVRTEQWSAAKPERWRYTWVQSRNVVRNGGKRIEVSYAHGTEMEYYPASNRLRVIKGLRGQNRPTIYPLGADPVATLRGMLDHGRLRDAGTATVGGREVRRLVGTRTRAFGKTRVTTTLEYDVDPATFAPVRARIELPIPHGAERYFILLDVTTFERLPLNAANAKLLRVQPRPGARIRVTRVK